LTGREVAEWAALALRPRNVLPASAANLRLLSLTAQHPDAHAINAGARQGKSAAR
jgi:hypothetical protein